MSFTVIAPRLLKVRPRRGGGLSSYFGGDMLATETAGLDAFSVLGARGRLGSLAAIESGSDVLASSGPITSSVRFNPGHYVGLQQNSAGTGTRDSAELRAVDVTRINAIRAESAVVGVNIKKFWYYFEGPTEGDYTRAFDMIDAYMAMVRDGSLPKKRLLVTIWPVVFSSAGPTNIFPEYVTDYVATNYGWISRLWEATTMSRIIALKKAITDRYASDPYFEGMETTETAIDFPSDPSGFSNANVLTQFKRLVTEYRANAPTCALIVGANYLGTNSQTLELLEHCRDKHVAAGGPDTWGIDWINDGTRSLQADGIYRGEGYNGQGPYIDLRGTMVWKNEVQNPEIGGYMTDGSGEHAPFTCADLYNTAYNINEAGYMIWEYNYGYGGDDQKWSTGTLPFIRANPNMRTNNPYNGVTGEVDPGGTGATTNHVSTGAVVEADNASVSPGFGSTPQLNDVGIIVASLTTGSTGRTLGCDGYATLASYGASSQQPLYIFAKKLAAGEASPTVEVFGGSAGNVLQAVGLLVRGARTDTGTMLHVSAVKSTTSASGSKAIDTPEIPITEDGCFVVEAVNYQLNCTTLSAPAGFTQPVFSSTLTGSNQALAVNTQLQTTATNIAAVTGGIEISGQATGVTARVLAVAIRGSSAAVSGQLAAGHWVAAKKSLRVVYPRPDSETPTWARHRWAYYDAVNSVEFDVPLGVQFGAYPYVYSIIDAPAGMTVGTVVGSADYGRVRWTPAGAVTGATVKIRVTDQDLNSIDVEWTVSTTSSTNTFMFASPSGNDSTGTGSIAAPFKTLQKLFGLTEGATTYPNRNLYLRAGTYTTPEQGTGYGFQLKSGSTPMSMMAFPGESVVLDLSAAGAVSAFSANGSNGSDLFAQGLELVGHPTTTNWRIWYIGQLNHRVTFDRISAPDVYQGSAANDNATLFYFNSPGGSAYRENLFIKECSETNRGVVGGGGNSGGITHMFCCRYVLVEDCVCTGSVAGYDIYLKASCSDATVRRNRIMRGNGSAASATGTQVDDGLPNQDIEICYNTMNAGYVANHSYTNPGAHWIYRNTFLGPISVNSDDGSLGSEGPYVIERNAIQISGYNPVQNNYTNAAPGVNTSVTDAECHGSSGIVDSSGLLISTYRTTYLGRRGAEIA